MIGIAWLCLLVAPASVDLVDEVYRIPADEWRYVEVSLKQQPALLSAEFEAREGSREVRAALLRREDLYRLRNDHPYGVLAATAPGSTGRFSYYAQNPEVYAVVVDNRDSDAPATVHLRVRLDFGVAPGPQAGTLSRGRQLAVIAISFAVFFGIVTWSARRLLRATRG